MAPRRILRGRAVLERATKRGDAGYRLWRRLLRRVSRRHQILVLMSIKRAHCGRGGASRWRVSRLLIRVGHGGDNRSAQVLYEKVGYKRDEEFVRYELML